MNDTQAKAAAILAEIGASKRSHQLVGEHVLAQASDLKPGEHKIVQIRSLEIGLYNVGGSFYALHNKCPHQFGPACPGPVTAQTVCDESTGGAFSGERRTRSSCAPGTACSTTFYRQSFPNKKVRLQTFPVRVVEGEVRVQFGGPRAGAAT